MKTGRLQTLGGVQYGTEIQIQTTALVGADGTYTNPILPDVTSVEGAIDALLSITPQYIEVVDTPYLILRAGDYVCMGGSNTLYLGNGLAVGNKVSIVGAQLWTLYGTSMRVGDKVGDMITALDEGSCITFLMTSQGWITTHLLGCVDILSGE
jgi:hypothetical protein